MAPHLRVDNLCRTFAEGGRQHIVLDNLTFVAARGEIIALRGRSGSGKSTLLNLISGIDTPDSGSVTIDDIDIVRLSERDRTLFRRRHIGFVYQSFNLIPTLTVADNVGLMLELNRVGGDELTTRVSAILAKVGLDDRARSYPDLLSGGEQQRVAIARALVHRPTLLLADEPTGNLDEEAAAVVLDILKRLVADIGTTMIIATHSNAVAAAADRSLSLSGDGELLRRSVAR